MGISTFGFRQPVPQEAASDASTQVWDAVFPSALYTAPEPHSLYDLSKRALDLGISLFLLMLTLPLISLAALAILLTTGQNPLFRQTRCGHQGRPFAMLKLRTMWPDSADGVVPAGELMVSKAPDDVRVTPVGRWLRRTSIDELPQLFNVLAGQMSLVGPRPALPVEVRRYPRGWLRRMSVKPGLTGLWQVSGRSRVGPARRTAMDLMYVRRRSLWFDCLILLRTVNATLLMRGAW